MYVWLMLFFQLVGALRVLHLLTHTCTDRRSSDLGAGQHGVGGGVHISSGGSVGGSSGVLNLATAAAGKAGSSGDVVLMSGASSLGRSGSVLIGSGRSEEHTSELQSLMRISYAVFCL